jgi:rpsU-divergently transcribed protein
MSMDTARERDMVYYRKELIRAALKKVHTLGWTQDAILAAIVEPPNDNNASPAFAISMVGLVTPFELVAYCMDDWNAQLEQFLLLHQKKKQESEPSMQLLYYQQAIQFRLSLALPYIQSGQWHTAMALGATQNTMTTHGQVHRIVELMTKEEEDASPSSSTTSLALHQAAVGAIYVATELHLLTDTSPNYQDTWTFLEHRLADYDQLRSSSSIGSAVSRTVQAAVQSAGHLLGSLSTSNTSTGPVAFATTAVVSSFLEGAASILLPLGGKATTSGLSTNRPTTGAVVFGTNPNDYAPPPSSMNK